jgi:hypothetical protein
MQTYEGECTEDATDFATDIRNGYTALARTGAGRPAAGV